MKSLSDKNSVPSVTHPCWPGVLANSFRPPPCTALWNFDVQSPWVSWRDWRRLPWSTSLRSHAAISLSLSLERDIQQCQLDVRAVSSFLQPILPKQWCHSSHRCYSQTTILNSRVEVCIGDVMWQVDQLITGRSYYLVCLLQGTKQNVSKSNLMV